MLGCVGCGVGVHLTICARHASIWMSVNNLVDYIYLIVKYLSSIVLRCLGKGA